MAWESLWVCLSGFEILPPYPMPPALPSPLVAALQQSSAYPHPCREIALRETHISWVFLTGDWVYKLKKPVQTNFLDFSTLERRRLCCEEELRLNRRFAPDLYVGVSTITGTPERPQMDGDGPVLEYAVRMRQFPEECLLSRVLATGRLTFGAIDQLAREIARVHGQATRSTLSDSWALAEQVRHEAVENLDAVEGAAVTEWRERLRALRAWNEQQWSRLTPVFEDRRRQGAVRECHGDLHLGNIVLWERPSYGDGEMVSPVMLFDCIEFNPALRWIDVMSDAAFLMMDLAERGRPEFAARFCNRYLEETGDYGGLAVLKWYLVYRALVRAKVAVLRAAQHPAESADRQRARGEAEAYIRLAEDYVRPNSPRLLLTCGVSGSGKTFGTQPLVDRMGMIRVRSDVERKRLAGLSSLASSGSGVGTGLYTSEYGRLTKDRLLECARAIVSAGWSAIVDATFLQLEDRQRFRTAAAQWGVPLVIVPFDADQSTLESRVTARQRGGADASEAGLEVLRHQLASREPLQTSELSECRTVEQILAGGC